MKDKDSQLNTVRALAVMIWGLIIAALFLPNHRDALLRGAFIMGGVLLAQLFFHSSSIEAKEVHLDAEKNRLNLG